MRAFFLLLTLGVAAWSPAIPAQGEQSAPVTVAEPGILDEVATADVEALKAESQLFDTIGKGVALSLAQCEGVADCQPAVNKAELEQLVATVDQRINSLAPRQTESGVEDLLVAYATVRDTYNQQLGKLGEIAPEPEAAPAEADAFGGEAPAESTESAATAEEFSIFEDADEALTDEPIEDEGAEPEAPQ